MALKGLAFLFPLMLFIVLAVDCRPSSLPVEAFESIANVEEALVETIEGKRAIDVELSETGVKISTKCTYTNSQKILIAVIAIMAVLSVIGCCVCCKSLCSDKNRPMGTNSIVYQSVSRPSSYHIQHLEPIPEGRCTPVQNQPPPYSSTTEAFSNGKRW
ncbi:unnamed protein product [Allacma fusca]|uniref:Uncharacterized protein n=2 Tax=Allacma fusca TaxID=39272 RepID=A0A8J2LMF0_9HEXA|nr:unnamed protein product [Allacma fusca]